LEVIAPEGGVAGGRRAEAAAGEVNYGATGHYAAETAAHSDLGNRRIEQAQDNRMVEDTHRDQDQTEEGAT